MNYAKELLSTSNFTVNEIAIKLGYFQTSSFIKKFRSIEGTTPGEYRKKQQAGREE
jgi:AraC-like DNA-binding protein